MNKKPVKTRKTFPVTHSTANGIFMKISCFDEIFRTLEKDNKLFIPVQN